MIKKQYKKESNCGLMNIDIIYDRELEEPWEIDVNIEKFGDCSAYDYISTSIQASLNRKEEEAEIMARGLHEIFTCNNGPNGCIVLIGRCLEEFIAENNIKY